MQHRRNKRVEKREVKKQACAAAQYLLLLQHVTMLPHRQIQRKICLWVQTYIDSTHMEGINNELKDLRAEHIDLKQQAAVSELTLNNLEGKDDKVKYLTGLSYFVVSYILPFLPHKKSMTSFQMLLMTLMRLRLNMPEQFLAYEFSVSQTTVSRIFSNVIDVLYTRTTPFVFWPEREELLKIMPLQFWKHFGGKVAVIRLLRNLYRKTLKPHSQSTNMIFLQAPQHSKVFDGHNTTGCNFFHFKGLGWSSD